MTLWEIDIFPAPGQPDVVADNLRSDATDLGLVADSDVQIAAGRGFLLQGKLSQEQVEQLAAELLADTVVESHRVTLVGDNEVTQPPFSGAQLVYVMLKPGVMDPVAASAAMAIRDFQMDLEAVATLRKYWIGGLDDQQLRQLCNKILANDAIERVILGPLDFDQLQIGTPYSFELRYVALRELDDTGLQKLSREGLLSLSLDEMQTIQAHFRKLERDPTDVELETLAQTWSEHCSHKTLAGRIAYRDNQGTRHFENMLKETIFAATQKIRAQLGEDDWCVSVFEDNAGVIRFDEKNHVVFKVETHNHPSALEPYGGANTGIGGVIRDPMGTGLGAQPICNTDVFCFAPPDTPTSELPPGVLHPRRVMQGVVAGVRDYGNRMGIPTVNGAVYFDQRYLGNPLVYCGNVGLLPSDKANKEPQPDDWIVAVGGRTGRDGIHGATFSSIELDSESESVSGGAVQIGNAITEKMLLDVILKARDQGLYHAITDCGAGGFSSAIGEMGEHLGAEVWLDRAPLKYDGLSYTEIWISEAQERMVLAVPPAHWETFQAVCQSEGVEATILGKFVQTGRLQLKYQDHEVADLAMEFLHDGRPPVIREAIYEPPTANPLTGEWSSDHASTLTKILGSLNVASKHWIIRQYDHEVQGGSVIKPLVGTQEDGPSDAAVVRPVLNSRRAVAVSCGMNPYYGDFDTYLMAASAIDEAVRNCVAVGADPERIAILDNFCWGNTQRPETLGSLVRAAIACHDIAVAFGTPFISGKDSLNNEFTYQDASGERQEIVIPPTLLISALGQVDDVRRCVTMDFKQAGNLIYQVGVTLEELGGSHFALTHQLTGGQVPGLDPVQAKRIYHALHLAIREGSVRACHDMSEGGLAVALAEMAFAGRVGARINLNSVPCQFESQARDQQLAHLLFAESNARFLCEIPSDKAMVFERQLEGLPCQLIGEVTQEQTLVMIDETNDPPSDVMRVSVETLQAAWKAPLDW
ncbi:MAG: phosphoribosylformylglycinamidine synthase subunit PurL [Pirellulaceae bacterium]|nr:phosphoribosylformylglycinamidine synthase subunit PurL [Pirellulaceae bacterium]